MLEHTARLIQSGVTRNLVIRFPTPDLTADSIRQDLEHIHRLDVVSIDFVKGHAYVSLNSVHLALKAKSCMISRLKYKRTRIEHFPDECDQPLPAIPRKPLSNMSNTLPTRAAKTPFSNRFDAIGWSSQTSCEDDESSLISAAPG